MFDWNQTEPQMWTVSELTRYIRELFEIDFRLQQVSVSGEISNFVRARSGHLYFTLKDANAQLKCVMWRSSSDRLGFSPEDGDAVIAYGRVSVYEAGGVYQLYADGLEPVGRGDLSREFELLKLKLAEEGLFESEFKRPVPKIPSKIGIVTSADAAALRDILNVLSRRWPLVSVLIAPTLVQGREAPPQIVRAIQWLDGRDDVDVIIVARGGGSLEDLWAFNEEMVARAIFAAEHPIIVGVGHETDFTIADFVADLRAPTPSAAAELAVPDAREIADGLTAIQAGLVERAHGILSEKDTDLQGLRRALIHLSPRAKVENKLQQVDWLIGRLDLAIDAYLRNARNRLLVAQTALETVSPTATLSRGYAIVRKPDGSVVRTVESVSTGEALSVRVLDGAFKVEVLEE